MSLVPPILPPQRNSHRATIQLFQGTTGDGGRWYSHKLACLDCPWVARTANAESYGDSIREYRLMMDLHRLGQDLGWSEQFERMVGATRPEEAHLDSVDWAGPLCANCERPMEPLADPVKGPEVVPQRWISGEIVWVHQNKERYCDVEEARRFIATIRAESENWTAAVQQLRQHRPEMARAELFSSVVLPGDEPRTYRVGQKVVGARRIGEHELSGVAGIVVARDLRARFPYWVVFDSPHVLEVACVPEDLS